MSNYIKPRGTVDLYDQSMSDFQQLQTTCFKIAKKFNFQQIKTPIFEHAELFFKSSGDTSDLVSKEMYLFKDKGDRLIALRPEATAGVIRAVVENKMLANRNTTLKLMYFEPCFRYERPQAGRQRQFHQFGVELLNSTSVLDDFEVIKLANDILKNLQINEYVLEINYISTAQKRKLWVEALKKYFSNYIDELEEISKQRVLTNPLRILDDKIESKKEFVKQAPKINEFLEDDEKQEFYKLLSFLDKNGIKYIINENLVRGLDYYSGVVFEFVSTSTKLQGQSTLIGGGRYGKLIADTGGPDVQGVGFGLGVERILIAINQKVFEQQSLDLLVISMSNEYEKQVYEIANIQRDNFNLNVDVLININKFDKIFKIASSYNAKKVVILAKKEMQENNVIVKDQQSFEQKTIAYNEIIKNKL